jgi:hypothetical protein
MGWGLSERTDVIASESLATGGQRECVPADIFEVRIWWQGIDASLDFTDAWTGNGEGENELVIGLS